MKDTLTHLKYNLLTVHLKPIKHNIFRENKSG